MRKDSWTEKEFWEQFTDDPINSHHIELVKRLLSWARSNGVLYWPAKTSAARLASFRASVDPDGSDHRLFQVWAETGGAGRGSKGLELLFAQMKPPYKTGSPRQIALRQQLGYILERELPPPENEGGQRPAVYLEELESESRCKGFLKVFEEMIATIKGEIA